MNQSRFTTLRNTILAVVLLGVFSSTPARADLVQYWPFDDGATNPSSTTAANLAAGGNVGTLNNFNNIGTLNTTGTWVTTSLPVAHSTAALDFDPPAVQANNVHDEDYVDGGDINLNIPAGGSGQVTVSMWVKPRIINVHDTRLFSQTANGDFFGGDGGTLRFDTNGGTTPGQLNVIVGAPNGGDVDFPGAGAELAANQWYHLAVVWNDDNSTLYVNGSNEGTIGTSPFSYSGGRNFGIGAKFGAPAGIFGKGFSGVIDDVAIWNQALPSGQIARLAGGASPLVIPEPSAAVLLGIATSMLLLRKRKTAWMESHGICRHST